MIAQMSMAYVHPVDIPRSGCFHSLIRSSRGTSMLAVPLLPHPSLRAFLPGPCLPGQPSPAIAARTQQRDRNAQIPAAIVQWDGTVVRMVDVGLCVLESQTLCLGQTWCL